MAEMLPARLPEVVKFVCNSWSLNVSAFTGDGGGVERARAVHGFGVFGDDAGEDEPDADLDECCLGTLVLQGASDPNNVGTVTRREDLLALSLLLPQADVDAVVSMLGQFGGDSAPVLTVTFETEPAAAKLKDGGTATVASFDINIEAP